MPSNPYTAPTIGSYNASPPPDDGSQVAANVISWAGIKTKLTDVLRTYADNINTAVTAAFASLVITTVVDEESAIIAYSNYARR